MVGLNTETSTSLLCDTVPVHGEDSVLPWVSFPFMSLSLQVLWNKDNLPSLRLEEHILALVLLGFLWSYFRMSSIFASCPKGTNPPSALVPSVLGDVGKCSTRTVGSHHHEMLLFSCGLPGGPLLSRALWVGQRPIRNLAWILVLCLSLAQIPWVGNKVREKLFPMEASKCSIHKTPD